jgi:hypothetical protein
MQIVDFGADYKLIFINLDIITETLILLFNI